MCVQRTFLAIKPDGVRRGLIPDILARFTRRGYTMVAAKLVQPDTETLEQLYEEHRGRPFLPGLIAYMSTGPVFAMVWEGENIIAEARAMMGATKPSDALPGTIRKDFCQTPERNVIHGSDSVKSAEREIGIWFKANEIIAYPNCNAQWMHPTA